MTYTQAIEHLADVLGRVSDHLADDLIGEPIGELLIGQTRKVAALQLEIANLQAFKTYVHSRLDAMGVPVDPESPHRAEGCRVGGRLDWVADRLPGEQREGGDQQ